MKKKKPKPKPPGTTPTQMRLTPETKAEIEAIRLHFGLSAGVDAVRLATHKLYQEITARKPKP